MEDSYSRQGSQEAETERRSQEPEHFFPRHAPSDLPPKRRDLQAVYSAPELLNA